MNFCVADAVLITLGKPRKKIEHAWNDKYSVANIHLNECNGVQHMFNIAKLTPSLFFDTIVDDVNDPRTSRINLVLF